MFKGSAWKKYGIIHFDNNTYSLEEVFSNPDLLSGRNLLIGGLKNIALAFGDRNILLENLRLFRRTTLISLYG